MKASGAWLNIALYRPEIPQNTGNIGRTCVGLELPLHIVGRPGFSLDDKHLRRAGLDYWDSLKLYRHENWNQFRSKLSGRIFCFSKGGTKNFYKQKFQYGDTFLFGRETEGLPSFVTDELSENIVYLPMPGPIRSYNLSNTVAIAAFEAYRQLRHS